MTASAPVTGVTATHTLATQVSATSPSKKLRRKIPGVATSRAAVILLITLVGFSMEAGLLLVVIVPLAWLASSAWVRYWGPALANLTLEAESRLMIQTLAISFTYGMLAVAAIRSDRQWMLLVSSIFAMAYYVWQKPAIAALILIVVTAEVGPELILVTAPFCVMLAMRDTRRRLRLPGTSARIATTLAFAVVALAFTLPFASLVFGGREPTKAWVADLDGTIERKVTDTESGLLGVLKERASTGSAHGPSVGITHRSIIGAIGLLLLLAAAYVIWRWFDTQAANRGARSASVLARLEAVGAKLGRRRGRSEGALSYADALSVHTADPRFTAAGVAISGTVYASLSSDEELAKRWLTALENEPPPLPADTKSRAVAGASYLPVTAQGLKSGAFVSAVLAALWFLLRLL